MVYAASNRNTAEVERTSYPTANSTSNALDPMTMDCVATPSRTPTSSPDSNEGVSKSASPDSSERRRAVAVPKVIDSVLLSESPSSRRAL